MEMNSVMHNDLKEVLLTEEDIQNICKELGAQLTKDYQGKPLVCVGILKGSAMFMSDLIKRIDTHLSIDFMDVSSYHGGTESTGEVQIIKDLGSSLANTDWHLYTSDAADELDGVDLGSRRIINSINT